MATQVNAPVEFTLDREEIEVNLTQKNLGTPRTCVIREMNGLERDAYLNSQRPKFAQAGNNLKDFADVQTSLIAQCLYDKTTDAKIPVTEIREFPSKLQTNLYKICMKVNGLDMSAEEEAKNS